MNATHTHRAKIKRVHWTERKNKTKYVSLSPLHRIGVLTDNCKSELICPCAETSLCRGDTLK